MSGGEGRGRAGADASTGTVMMDLNWQSLREKKSKAFIHDLRQFCGFKKAFDLIILYI